MEATRIAGPNEAIQRAVHRIAWANEAAKSEWIPRLPRIREALLMIRLDAVARSELTATVVSATLADLPALLASVAELKLVALPIDAALDETAARTGNCVAAEVGEFLIHRLLVSRPHDIDAVVSTYTGNDARAWRRLIGHPDCCADAAACQSASDAILAWLSGRGSLSLGKRSKANIPWETNILLRQIGIVAVPHDPCGPDCKASADLAVRLVARGIELGHLLEMQWLSELLLMPMEFSVVNKIAEVKLPILRFLWSAPSATGPIWLDRVVTADLSRSTRTRASDERGAGGAAWFPALVPAEEDNIGQVLATTDDLAMQFARRGRLASVVWTHARLLRRLKGAALDVGCEDGLLLELARLEAPGLSCWGVDPSAAAIAQARRRHLDQQDHFFVGSIDRGLLTTLSRLPPLRLIFLRAGALSLLEQSERSELVGGLLRTKAEVVIHADDTALAASNFALLLRDMQIVCREPVPVGTISAVIERLC